MANNEMTRCTPISMRAAVAMVVASSALLVTGCNADRLPEAVVDSSTPAAAQPAAPGDGELPSTRETAESTPADIDLTTKVESALAAETQLHGSPIGVTAADGVVTLTGSTKDPQLRSMAAQVALSVGGVRLVKNELTVSVEA